MEVCGTSKLRRLQFDLRSVCKRGYIYTHSTKRGWYSETEINAIKWTLTVPSFTQAKFSLKMQPEEKQKRLLRAAEVPPF